MKWKKYTLETTTDAVDMISATLAELGIEGVEVEDNVPLTESETKGMFIDILPELPPDDGTARVSFYLDPEDAVEEKLSEVRESLEELRQFMDPGPCSITESETEDKDWINNWKEFFHPFTVGDILIKPTWEALPEGAEGKTLIQIDPGTAFGTGAHETTQLCIRQIRKYLTPETVMLDVGTGSGILAILALMFGIRSAVGTDLDPCAPPAIEDNLKTNGVDPSKLEVILGNLIDDPQVQAKVGTERYDIVAANILADVLIPLTPHVVPAMKPGAYYITSGILEGREDSVAEAMRQAGLEVVSVTAQGEWRCVVGRKPLA